jgi:hypothetical protein
MPAPATAPLSVLDHASINHEGRTGNVIRLIREADHPADAAQVDDAALRFPEVREGVLAAEELAPQVGVNGELPLLLGGVLDQIEVRLACVVEQRPRDLCSALNFVAGAPRLAFLARIAPWRLAHRANSQRRRNTTRVLLPAAHIEVVAIMGIRRNRMRLGATTPRLDMIVASTA